MVRRVAARQPSIRRGRYWIFLQLALDDADQAIQVGGGEVDHGALEQRPDAASASPLRRRYTRSW
jgi:hypothetical protein